MIRSRWTASERTAGVRADSRAADTSGLRRGLRQDEAGAGALGGRLVVEVVEAAAGQGEAAAADAAGEVGLEPLQLGDLVVDAALPGAGDAVPLGGRRD